MLLLALVNQVNAKTLLNEAWAKVAHATTVSATVITGSEEFSGKKQVRYTLQKGGYFRAEQGTVVDVMNPKQGYTYDTAKKIYQVRQPVSGMKLDKVFGVDLLKDAIPKSQAVERVNWHGQSVFKIPIKDMGQFGTSSTLVVYIDPQTHIPAGISVNLGSITQIRKFVDMRINPKLPDGTFKFAPPKAWKQVNTWK